MNNPKYVVKELSEYPEVKEAKKKVVDMKQEVSYLKVASDEKSAQSLYGKLIDIEAKLEDVLSKYNIGEASENDVRKYEDKIYNLEQRIKTSKRDLRAKEKSLKILEERYEDAIEDAKQKRIEEFQNAISIAKQNNEKLVEDFVEEFSMLFSLKVNLNDINRSDQSWSRKAIREHLNPIMDFIKYIAYEDFKFDEYDNHIFKISRSKLRIHVPNL